MRFHINFSNIPARIGDSISSLRSDMRSMKGTNIWFFIMYGLLFDVVNNLWRPFSVKFLERLGGGTFEIALLSALPGLVAALILLPGAFLFRRFTNKKRATAAFIMISRTMLLFIAFLPVFPAQMKPLLFVVLVAIMNFPDSLSQTSLQSLLGSIFNGTMRGQAIALRTKFGQAIIPIVTIFTGLAITFIPSNEAQRMIMYQFFFIGAFILGMVEVFVFNKLQIASAPVMDLEDFLKTGGKPSEPVKHEQMNLINIIQDKKFKAFCIPALIFAFTWQAGWPLFSIHQVITLGATEFWLAIFAIASGISIILSGRFWQSLLRRHGNNHTFIVAVVLLAINCFIWPLVPNVHIMVIASAITGFSAIGINTAMLNGLLEATPDTNRMTYIAFYNTLLNVSLFLAPFFAHFLLTLIGNRNALFVVGIMRGVAAVFIYIAHKRSKKLFQEV